MTGRELPSARNVKIMAFKKPFSFFLFFLLPTAILILAGNLQSRGEVMARDRTDIFVVSFYMFRRHFFIFLHGNDWIVLLKR